MISIQSDLVFNQKQVVKKCEQKRGKLLYCRTNILGIEKIHATKDYLYKSTFRKYTPLNARLLCTFLYDSTDHPQ